ncbi:MAG: hypothetical protein ACTICQ_08320 [Glutamicibacter arilaitensis]|uniref:hypothetical protein n=1 Tax=Glutamicibacter arilaitensis TaxID=256701 RepID=UPI003FB668BC
MSDNSQPVSSRRALREKRRAEMEAMLANSKAEQAAKELASKNVAEAEAPAKPAKSGQAPQAKPAPKAEPASKIEPASKTEPAKSAAAKPQASKPAAKSEAKPVAKPAPKPAVSEAPAAKAEHPKPAGAKQQAIKPVAKPAQAPAKAENAKTAAKPASAPAAEEPLGERASLRRARDREALRERRRLEEEVGALTTNIPTVSPAEDPKPLTRRQLRLQALADQGKVEPQPKAPAKPAGKEDTPETTVMSVEQALAARRAHEPNAPVDPNLLGEDDSEIDLEVLAHQREMAARAAIISRRAAERERLRIQNANQGKDDKASDPFTGAMGNIREVEDRIAKTGVQGPKTQSVALDLNADGKLSSKKDEAAPAAKKPMAKPAKPAAKTPVKPAAKAPAKPAAKPAAKPVAKPLAKPVAEEPARSKPKTQASEPAAGVEMPRIDAVNAQGLQPLDVQAHGLRRANNMLIAMIVALSLGGAALIAGLIMLLGN